MKPISLREALRLEQEKRITWTVDMEHRADNKRKLEHEQHEEWLKTHPIVEDDEESDEQE